MKSTKVVKKKSRSPRAVQTKHLIIGKMGFLSIRGVTRLVIFCAEDQCAHPPSRCFLCDECESFGIARSFAAGRLAELKRVQAKVNEMGIEVLL